MESIVAVEIHSLLVGLTFGTCVAVHAFAFVLGCFELGSAEGVTDVTVRVDVDHRNDDEVDEVEVVLGVVFVNQGMQRSQCDFDDHVDSQQFASMVDSSEQYFRFVA